MPPNLLHRQLSVSGVHVVGFRMPAFAKAERAFKRTTFAWLLDAAESLLAAPALIIGDFNTAPGDPPRECGDCLEAFQRRGWRLAVPPLGHSWATRAGRGRRIDFALVSPGLAVTELAYSWRFRDLGEDAASGKVGRPDHAMLLVGVERASISAVGAAQQRLESDRGAVDCTARPHSRPAPSRVSRGVAPWALAPGAGSRAVISRRHPSEHPVDAPTPPRRPTPAETLARGYPRPAVSEPI